MITLRPYTATARVSHSLPFLAQGRPGLDTEGERSGLMWATSRADSGERLGKFTLE